MPDQITRRPTEDPRRPRSREVLVFVTSKLDVRGKVGDVGDILLDREPPERVGRDVVYGPRVAVVPVLENDADAVRGLGELLDDAGLQEVQSRLGGSFAAEQANHRAARLVPGIVDDVLHIEGRLSRGRSIIFTAGEVIGLLGEVEGTNRRRPLSVSRMSCSTAYEESRRTRDPPWVLR